MHSDQSAFLRLRQVRAEKITAVSWISYCPQFYLEPTYLDLGSISSWGHLTVSIDIPIQSDNEHNRSHHHDVPWSYLGHMFNSSGHCMPQIITNDNQSIENTWDWSKFLHQSCCLWSVKKGWRHRTRMEWGMVRECVNKIHQCLTQYCRTQLPPLYCLLICTYLTQKTVGKWYGPNI